MLNSQTAVEKAVSIINSRGKIAEGFTGKLTNVKVTNVHNYTDAEGREKVIINFIYIS